MESAPRNIEGTLILVCCHAIYDPTLKNAYGDSYSPFDERSWLLAPFQRSRGEPSSPDHKEGEHLTFLRHISTGVLRLLSSLGADKNVLDPVGMLSQQAQEESQSCTPNVVPSRGSSHKGKPAHLIISGGATKRSEGCNETEAQSYLDAFHAALNVVVNADGVPQELQSCTDIINNLKDASVDSIAFNKNIHCEELATDSFQNILFSLLVFRQVAGTWPLDLMIVTHKFKTPRVKDYHLRAIKWPEDRCEVIGLDPSFSSAEEEMDVKEAEYRRGYLAWSQDLYGCKTDGILGRKRRERGWDGTESLSKVEVLLDGLSDKENVILRRLLTWEGGETGTELFPDKLPWEHSR